MDVNIREIRPFVVILIDVFVFDLFILFKKPPVFFQNGELKYADLK